MVKFESWYKQMGIHNRNILIIYKRSESRINTEALYYGYEGTGNCVTYNYSKVIILHISGNSISAGFFGFCRNEQMAIKYNTGYRKINYRQDIEK